MIPLFTLLAAWFQHTDASRARANDLRESLIERGVKHEAAASDMGIRSVKQFTRQLAGVEPMNVWRLTALPLAVQASFIGRWAAALGLTVLTHEQVELLRGAAQVGPAHMAKMLPVAAERREA